MNPAERKRFNKMTPEQQAAYQKKMWVAKMDKENEDLKFKFATLKDAGSFIGYCFAIVAGLRLSLSNINIDPTKPRDPTRFWPQTIGNGALIFLSAILFAIFAVEGWKLIDAYYKGKNGKEKTTLTYFIALIIVLIYLGTIVDCVAILVGFISQYRSLPLL